MADPRAAHMAISHLAVLDGLKGIAAQLIVLHHLAFYGPMSDAVRPVAPLVMDWLSLYGRMAVQVFLVVSGFLAARALCPNGVALRASAAVLSAQLQRRYLKLAPPFVVAMVLAAGASAAASIWMTHESISAPPTAAQLLAHALLLHDILGYDALSAGAWYVAIDFQLYALLAGIVWLCGRGMNASSAVPVLLAVTTGVCASLLVFNRHPALDIWAPYFFASYGLGALAWWAQASSGIRKGMLLAAMLALGMLGLVIDFRERIVLALLLAMLLACWRGGCMSLPKQGGLMEGMLAWFGQISYSVFLVHFPVCLVVNAVFTRFFPRTPGWQGMGLACAWLASILAGAAFFYWVERPLAQRLLAPKAAGTAQVKTAS